MNNPSHKDTQREETQPQARPTSLAIKIITIARQQALQIPGTPKRLSGTTANGRRPKAPPGSTHGWDSEHESHSFEEYKSYHSDRHKEQYEYKKNAEWYSTSSSSVTNEKCKGKPNAPTPPWRKGGDIRSEKHTWCTANKWQQVRAGADPSTAAAAAADEATESINSSSGSETDEAYEAAAARASEATAAAQFAAAAAVAAAAAAASAVATDAANARASAVTAANAATAAVARAQQKEDKYWKSFAKGNEKKSHKTNKNSRFEYSTWPASTTLDDVLEEDEEEEEIDPEHPFRGHYR